MKDSIRSKLDRTVDRFEEVGRLLSDASTIGGSPQFRDLSVEYARLEPLAALYRSYVGLESELAAAQELAVDADPEMRALGEEEDRRIKAALAAASAELGLMLLPKDPNDERNIFLEVRA